MWKNFELAVVQLMLAFISASTYNLASNASLLAHLRCSITLTYFIMHC